MTSHTTLRLKLIFFFFSSRRRHTRWNCDWSSDVCSSDLLDDHSTRLITRPYGIIVTEGILHLGVPTGADIAENTERIQIGRASCRERVEIWVVGVALKEKKIE